MSVHFKAPFHCDCLLHCQTEASYSPTPVIATVNAQTVNRPLQIYFFSVVSLFGVYFLCARALFKKR